MNVGTRIRLSLRVADFTRPVPRPPSWLHPCLVVPGSLKDVAHPQGAPSHATLSLGGILSHFLPVPCVSSLPRFRVRALVAVVRRRCVVSAVELCPCPPRAVSPASVRDSVTPTSPGAGSAKAAAVPTVTEPKGVHTQTQGLPHEVLGVRTLAAVVFDPVARGWHSGRP